MIFEKMMPGARFLVHKSGATDVAVGYIKFNNYRVHDRIKRMLLCRGGHLARGSHEYLGPNIKKDWNINFCQ